MLNFTLLKAYLIFSSIFLLITSVYNEENTIRIPRMIGSLKANGMYPYVVSLQLKRGVAYVHYCGGSIINERTVITAAHCLYYHIASGLRVHAGEKSRTVKEGKVYNVEALYCHDKYKDFNHDYDVGLLRIVDSFEFSDNIQLIVLADSNDFILDGSYGTVMGWGVTDLKTKQLAEYLMVADIPIVKNKVCNRFMGGMITERMLCAGFFKGGIDACQMDSGGPLVYNNKLAGIVSWGVGCARPKRPGVYTRISNVLPWVEKVLLQKYGEVLKKPTEFVETEITHLLGLDLKVD